MWIEGGELCFGEAELFAMRQFPAVTMSRRSYDESCAALSFSRCLRLCPPASPQASSRHLHCCTEEQESSNNTRRGKELHLSPTCFAYRLQNKEQRQVMDRAA